MTIYSAIKDIAKERSVSIYKIEKDLQLSHGLIFKWDKSNPSINNIQKVANYLGVTTTYILDKAKED